MNSPIRRYRILTRLACTRVAGSVLAALKLPGVEYGAIAAQHSARLRDQSRRSNLESRSGSKICVPRNEAPANSSRSNRGSMADAF